MNKMEIRKGDVKVKFWYRHAPVKIGSKTLMRVFNPEFMPRIGELYTARSFGDKKIEGRVQDIEWNTFSNNEHDPVLIIYLK